MRYYEVLSHREEFRLSALSRVEFEVTKRAILASLPSNRALKILDIGGATGEYSFWLRGLGHDLTLVDRSPRMIKIARGRYAECEEERSSPMRIEVGDAKDLSHLPDASFDAILSLGPQYHLIEDQDVASSLRELNRLIKPEGVIFSAFLHKLGTLRWWWNKRPDVFASRLQFFEEFRRTGIFPEVEWSAFNDYRSYYPDEIVQLMSNAGLTTSRLLNCEGYGGTLGLIDDLTEEALEQLAEYAYTRADDPESIQLSEHLLWVGSPAS